MEKLQVRTSEDIIEDFDPYRIVKQLMRESDIKRIDALTIANEVERLLKDVKPRYLTTALIRKLVDYELINYSMCKVQQQQTTVGMPVFDIKQLVESGNRDNANMIHNPETAHKHVADNVMKQLTLDHILPSHLADAHRRGDMHIHDLEFFFDRPLNCMQHDLRQFIRYGLCVDGTGDHTSVAGPPKHLETVMNHSGEIMLAAQQNMSGGQSMPLWNVFAAPFAKGRSYDEIKQCVEMLVFNLNMAYAARGSQVPFTSINLEFTVPDFLKDEPAWGPKGKRAGRYGDYEEETRQLQRAFTEVLMNGDAYGKPHLFPNTIYVLRKEMMNDEFSEDLLNVHRLAAKFGTPYFANMLVDYRGQTPHANYMGCRTCLNTNWTGNWERDTLRTGNFAYITINLPRLALKTKGDRELYFVELYKVLEMAKEVLLLKREHALKCLDEYKLMPFLSQKSHDYKSPFYYSLENATLSFGFVGLHEALLGLGFGDGIESDDGSDFGVKIVEFMNTYAGKLNEKTGDHFRWTILQSPAESTAWRFARLDTKEFEGRAIVNGKNSQLGYTNECVYYTNSSHVPVDSKLLLPQRIKIEEKFHPLTKGGHIFHAFLGEAKPDPEALMSLTKHIAENSQIGFWAYTVNFSFCLECKKMMNGLQEECIFCGGTEEVEHYSRITGYLQQIGKAKSASGGWNKGKLAEFEDRTDMIT